LKAFLLCLVIGGSGVGYVWQKNQIYDLGRQIKHREIRLTGLEDQNNKLKKQLANLRSPGALESRLKEMGLMAPLPAQIRRVPEPTGEFPSIVRDRQYAVQAGEARIAP
jgi:hypothetical protein